MNIFKAIFCKHNWNWHGWSYVKCKKCGYTKVDEQLNEKLQKQFWEQRIIDGHHMFGREAINKHLAKMGRSL